MRTLEFNWNINGKNKYIYTEQNALSSYAPKVPLSLKETSMYFTAKVARGKRVSAYLSRGRMSKSYGRRGDRIPHRTE